MKSFTIYNPTTLEIIRSGLVMKDSDATVQAADGEEALIGERGDPANQKIEIVDGAPALVEK
jgi:hypothetical protein